MLDITQEPIRNTSKVEQFVINENGERLALGPYERKVVDKLTAAMFVKSCAPHVVRERHVNVIEEDIPIGERVWLYNATGNPDEKPTIQVSKLTRQGKVFEEIRNPRFEPFELSYELDGGQKTVNRGGEETALNMPARKIKIPPYSRKAFTKVVSDNLILLDTSQEKPMRGVLRPASEPGFEPDNTWSLEDIQLYAKTIDPELRLGKTEATLKKDHTKPPKRSNKSLDTLIEEEKTDLLRRLFFRLADPKYKTLTREEWERVLAKATEAVA